MNALRGHTGTETFFDQDLSDDMPFAVDALNSGSNPTNAAAAGSTAVGNSALASMMNEASLVASMCTAAPKRLAMFDSKHITSDGERSSQSSQHRQRQEENLTLAMDSLAEQLADFKSFGNSLTATSSGVAPFSPEAPTASAGSG
jgi:hypothetical protein